MTGDDLPTFTRRSLLKGSAAALPAAAWGAGRPSAQEVGSSPVATAIAPTTPLLTLVAGNTGFAFDLYAVVRQSMNGNLIFSPYSISQALAMTYAGARGETATQMAETLSFQLSQPGLDGAFHDLNADLVARGNAREDPKYGQAARGLRIANGLWGEQTYPLSESYSALIERSYGAGLQSTDFNGAPEAAREHINEWVAKQTEDHIKNIVPEGGITAATRLVLANAIYFYGPWQSTFSTGDTQDGDFFLVDGTTVTVPFMSQRVHLPYTNADGFQVIEFPFEGSSFTFTVILPDKGRFDAVEATFDPGALNEALRHLTDTDVRVSLPKFRFNYDTDLANTLRSMGMTDAFDPRRADFSGMLDGTPPEPLFIGGVLHSAFISVDENGAEAAAATVVGMVGSAAPSQTEPLEVRIDRPFICAIRDTETGALLFMGRVVNPAGSR
ncbi:MAG TPA: serpin family protein [Thermomicrobiales bacterium]|nr:serpin family protein [Thermomicrobiales bacterium]